MKRIWLKSLSVLALVLSTLFSISGCYSFFTFAKAATINFRGPLKVGIHRDFLTHSLERDLIRAFAQDHSIKINFVSFESIEEAEALLNQEKVDLVFPRTSLKTSNFKGHFLFAYDDLKLSVVCSGKLEKATSLAVPYHYNSMSGNATFSKKFENLYLFPTHLTAQELQNIARNKPGFCYLTDSRLGLRHSLHFPHLRLEWTAKKADSVAWVTRNELVELNQLIHIWFQNLVRKKQHRRFWDRYESVEFKMSLLEHRRFTKDMALKLPKWKKLFEKNAHLNQIPWTLLASVAYQESKWNEDAVSHTGVRGLMQLTEDTAKQVGVIDRKNPQESVRGGAYYLKYLFDKTGPQLPTYERWAQALSAYNMGWAHLRDARVLAKKLNKDPTRWIQFKTVLPLLSDKKYYSQLSFGPARGEETVDFVEQVLGYTELLNSAFTRRLPTSQDF